MTKRSRFWEIADLAGVKDLAERYGVGHPTVVNWSRRYPTFPKPITFIGGSPVYSYNQVALWRATHDWKNTLHK